MPILTILIVLIIVGVVLYLINNYIPMDRKIKSILNIVVVICVIIWLLKAFGLFDSLGNVKVQLQVQLQFIPLNKTGRFSATAADYLPVLFVQYWHTDNVDASNENGFIKETEKEKITPLQLHVHVNDTNKITTATSEINP